MNSFLKNTMTIASFCIFFSCNPNAEEPENETSVNYDFKSITYRVESDDFVSTYEFFKSLLTYKNETGNVQSYTIDYILGNVSNSSRFYANDLPLISNLLDSVYVNIPVFANNDNSIILSDTLYRYTMGITNFPPAMNAQTVLYIEPHQTVSVQCKYRMIKYTLGYTAVFKERNSGEELNIDGKWEGCFLQGIDPEITQND